MGRGYANFLELRKSEVQLGRVYLARECMNALPLAPRQSVNVQPSQGSSAARPPDLQRLKLMQTLVEPSCEMCLVSSYLLQSLLVRQKALPGHVPKIPLHLLGFNLSPLHFESGAPGRCLQQLFRLFVGGLRDGLYDRT